MGQLTARFNFLKNPAIVGNVTYLLQESRFTKSKVKFSDNHQGCLRQPMTEFYTYMQCNAHFGANTINPPGQYCCELTLQMVFSCTPTVTNGRSSHNCLRVIKIVTYR